MNKPVDPMQGQRRRIAGRHTATLCVLAACLVACADDSPGDDDGAPVEDAAASDSAVGDETPDAHTASRPEGHRDASAPHTPDGAVDSGSMCSGCSGETETCNDDCTPADCGDKKLNLTAGERCDGPDHGLLCSDFASPGTGPFYAGQTQCDSSCEFDLSDCSGYCGDGTKDAGEACDTTLADTCETLGFFEGTATCDSACAIDTGACVTAVALTVVRDGAGSIAVVQRGALVGTCSDDTCVYDVAPDEVVTLTGTPSGDFAFNRWSGQCAGAPADCMTTPTTDLSITGTFTGTPNVVFYTTGFWSPSQLGGSAGADAKCQAEANGSGSIPAGTYVAFFSTTTVSATSKLVGARGWVRPDGKPVGDSIEGMLEGEVFYPPSQDSAGAYKTPGETAFTGTETTGSAVDNCADWSSDTTGLSYHGLAYGGGNLWARGQRRVCTVSGYLLCFGTDYDTPVLPDVSEGRIAFLSEGTVLLSVAGGVAPSDAVCTAEASAAKLPGTYKAVMASDAVAPAGRFSTAGDPWIRPDYVPLFSPATDLPGFDPIAAINQRADGSYVKNATVAVGGLVAGNSNCLNWTSDQNPNRYRAGMAAHAGDEAFDEDLAMCGDPGSVTTAHVYCFQE